jgi:hypothetical protein
VKIKVISLWHPWALAMWKNLKRYETRSEYAPVVAQLRHYRGWLGIHAAQMPWLKAIDKSFEGEGIEVRKAFALKCIDLLNDAPVDRKDFGCIGAVCKFEGGIFQTQTVRNRLSEEEKFWGNYSDGRRAIHCPNMIRLDEPVPMRGHQGLFDWDVSEAKIEKWEAQCRTLA